MPIIDLIKLTCEEFEISSYLEYGLIYIDEDSKKASYNKHSLNFSKLYIDYLPVIRLTSLIQNKMYENLKGKISSNPDDMESVERLGLMIQDTKWLIDMYAANKNEPIKLCFLEILEIVSKNFLIPYVELTDHFLDTLLSDCNPSKPTSSYLCQIYRLLAHFLDNYPYVE
ncbi:hypothetical protein MXB_864, partial [Myxobolus squamalis]